MVGKGIAQARMGKLMAFKEEKQKLADQAAVNNPAVDKIAYADRPKAMQEASPSIVQSAQEANPSLQKMTWKNTGIVPMPGQGEYRQEALRDMDEDTFRKHQGTMNASPYEYWTEQVKANPESTYAIVNQMFASNETPEEKAKRERREALGETFRGLGNLIGNAANLYYATKGGTPIDLNTANEKHLERMQRIKDKQDALDEQRKQMIVNAKLSDVKTARAERASKAKTDAEAAADALKYKRDLALKQIENAYKLGQIDAQTKAELAKQVAKFKSDKELEAFKQQGRVTLKGMKSGDSKANDDKILTSLTGSDGGTWTRNTNLSKEELRELSKYVEDWSPYTKVDENGKETIDYLGAIADASDSGLIPDYILEEKGFKRSKDSARRKKSEGFSFASQNNGFSFK